ncbi:MAG: hypothetical protein J0H19_01635 [Rhodospirillales bacterium]|jgi:hypothetical protein|nr:hypothetical protein [Rhodospirillales bacterium]MBN8925304.1 hypothetical protein [Rhodospirillales bacterium]
MKRLLLALAARLARDPSTRGRLMDWAGRLRPHQYGPQQTPVHGYRRFDDRSGAMAPWGGPVLDTRPAFRSGRGIGSLLWLGCAVLLVVWSLLSIGAYGLLSLSGDWLLAQSGSLGRSLDVPVELTGPVTWVLRLVRDFGGPALLLLWFGVSAAILLLTVVASRILGVGR